MTAAHAIFANFSLYAGRGLVVQTRQADGPEGAPLAYTAYEDSGYPISVILAFEEFGQALLARWQGRSVTERLADMTVPFQALPSRPGMEEFVRGKLGRGDDGLVAVTLLRGAGSVSSLSRADGIIRIPLASEGLLAGQPGRWGSCGRASMWPERFWPSAPRQRPRSPEQHAAQTQARLLGGRADCRFAGGCPVGSLDALYNLGGYDTCKTGELLWTFEGYFQFQVEFKADSTWNWKYQHTCRAVPGL